MTVCVSLWVFNQPEKCRYPTVTYMLCYILWLYNGYKVLNYKQLTKIGFRRTMAMSWDIALSMTSQSMLKWTGGRPLLLYIIMCNVYRVLSWSRQTHFTCDLNLIWSQASRSERPANKSTTPGEVDFGTPN